jgi:hypothetical protein
LTKAVKQVAATMDMNNSIGCSTDQFKVFHFQEIDWLVYFPSCGNTGKYCNYSVLLRERKGGLPRPGKRVTLSEVLDNPEFEKRYPHTVGFYKSFSEEGADFEPRYLEIRIIRTVEEFWLFLNALNI